MKKTILLIFAIVFISINANASSISIDQVYDNNVPSIVPNEECVTNGVSSTYPKDHDFIEEKRENENSVGDKDERGNSSYGVISEGLAVTNSTQNTNLCIDGIHTFVTDENKCGNDTYSSVFNNSTNVDREDKENCCTVHDRHTIDDTNNEDNYDGNTYRAIFNKCDNIDNKQSSATCKVERNPFSTEIGSEQRSVMKVLDPRDVFLMSSDIKKKEDVLNGDFDRGLKTEEIDNKETIAVITREKIIDKKRVAIRIYHRIYNQSPYSLKVESNTISEANNPKIHGNKDVEVIRKPTENRPKPVVLSELAKDMLCSQMEEVLKKQYQQVNDFPRDYLMIDQNLLKMYKQF